MKTFLITLSAFFVVCFNELNAQSIIATMRENSSESIHKLDKESTLFFSDGDYREAKNNVISGELSDDSWIAAWFCDVEVEKDEVVIMQSYVPVWSIGVYPQMAIHFFGIEDTESQYSWVTLDTLDYNTMIMRAKSNGVMHCQDVLLTIWNDGGAEQSISEERFHYSIAIQKYGLLSDFTLVPIKNQSQSISDWVTAQAFTPETSRAEIMWHLTNDLECQATDTYGQEIDLISTYYSWKLDMEEGTATFTPYFTPRQFKTTWKSGEPFELSLGTNKAAPLGDENAYHDSDGKLVLRLWSIGGGTVTDIATINANATAQDVWYDMFGRKYITKPTAPGLYIHNGKKEVVK